MRNTCVQVVKLTLRNHPFKLGMSWRDVELDDDAKRMIELFLNLLSF